MRKSLLGGSLVGDEDEKEMGVRRRVAVRRRGAGEGTSEEEEK